MDLQDWAKKTQKGFLEFIKTKNKIKLILKKLNQIKYWTKALSKFNEIIKTLQYS